MAPDDAAAERAADRADERPDDGPDDGPDVRSDGAVPPIEDDPEARLYTSTELEDENGEPYVIQQQNVGPGRELGGGEWPDPDTPPQAPAPGSA